MQLLPEPQAADTQRFVDIRNNHTLLRYFQNIEKQFMFANNFGVAIDDNDQAETGIKAVYLRELLVRPNLSKYHITPEQIVLDEIKRQPLNDFSIAELLVQHPRMVVLGDPGTGKSTLINSLMLAFSYYTDNLTKIALGKRVPFALILRDLSLTEVNNWNDLWQEFLTRNHDTLTAPLNEDKERIKQVLDSGQALIMLDGLDEITHSGQRLKLGKAVLEAMQRFPRCLFLITSRVIGFNQAEWFGLTPEAGVQALPARHGMIARMIQDIIADLNLMEQPPELLPSFYLSPFNQQQVQQFVSNWYGLYVPKQANHSQRIDDLKHCLQGDNGLGHLARIPVLLNMICFIHARRGRLPDGRFELYQRISETYLVSLDKARGIKFKDHELRFDYYDLTEWLSEMAYTLQTRRTEQAGAILMAASEVQKIILNGLAERGFADQQASNECQFILDYLAQRSGLFIPRGKNTAGEEQYAFSHLSFLEYFSACFLKREAPLFNAEGWGNLRPRTEQVWWHETLALFFESLENAKLADKYLTALFDSGEPGKDESKTSQQNLLADIVMDTSVRLPLATRQFHIKILTAACLKNFDSNSHLAFRLCSKHYNAFEQLKTARELSFDNTAFNQFALLAQLTQLQHLSLNHTCISDLQPLQGLNALQILQLEGCPITTLQPLAKLKQLDLLFISDTAVQDISPLIELTALTTLALSNTEIKDFSPLMRLQQLKLLFLNGTKIIALSPLKALVNLQLLELEATAITDLSPLKTLVNLEVLNLGSTVITDLSPLKALVKLEYLYLESTTITDLQALAQLTKLEELSLNNTTITDLSPLVGLTALRHLDIRGTTANAAVLKHLPNLKVEQ